MDMKLWNFLERIAPIKAKTVYVNTEVGEDEGGNTLWRIEVEDEYESIEGEFTDTQKNIEAILEQDFNIETNKTVKDVIYNP